MGAEPRTAETPDGAATLSDDDASAGAAHDPIAAGATIGRYIGVEAMERWLAEHRP